MTRATSILEKFLSVLAIAVFLLAAVLFTIGYVLVVGVIALVRRCRAATSG